jgi:hypothetical protein
LTVGKSVVQDHVNRLMGKVHQAGRKPVSGDIEELLSGLLSLPSDTWEVFRVLHGATVSTDAPLVLGSFTIYNCTKHWSAIVTRFPQAE